VEHPKKTDIGPRDYDAVFSGPQGRAVLAHMLFELDFFNDAIDTQEQRIRSNYARRLLGHLGRWRLGNEKRFVDKMFEIQMLKPEDR
jgi:hypothetical protein